MLIVASRASAVVYAVLMGIGTKIASDLSLYRREVIHLC